MVLGIKGKVLSVALTAGLILGAVLLAKKYNVGKQITSGLSGFGQTIGTGLASIPVGIAQGATGVFQDAAGQFSESIGGLTDWWKGGTDWLFGGSSGSQSVDGGKKDESNKVINQDNRENSDSKSKQTANGGTKWTSSSFIAKQQALSEKYGITTYDIKGNISTVPQTRAGIALSQKVAKSGDYIQHVDKSGKPIRRIGFGAGDAPAPRLLPPYKKPCLNCEAPTPNQSQSKAVTGGKRPADTSSASKAVKAANTSKPSASKAVQAAISSRGNRGKR